eukprot:TRINITY_DN9482_c0_g2_i1.p1 TRINITY_DN9482_c0_g2~~TRINITY_DN9482_c0_g2_i1.p1  ORF type:complete len:534 (-),score=53.38 TRINITY_DN9482_c0_g2_i1:486-2087(-)
MNESLYDILGVAPAATFVQLRVAYKRRVLEVHPDKGGSVELCQKVVLAFERLADPVFRRNYDRRLVSGERCSHAKSSAHDCKRRASASERGKQMEQPCSETQSSEGCRIRKAATMMSSEKLKGDSSFSRTSKPLVAQAQSTEGSCEEQPTAAKRPRTDNSASADLPVNESHVDSKCAWQTGNPSGDENVMHRILNKLVDNLRLLLRQQRHEFIAKELTQAQRRVLEAHMVSTTYKDRATDSNLDLATQVECFSESEESDYSSADDTLALEDMSTELTGTALDDFSAIKDCDAKAVHTSISGSCENQDIRHDWQEDETIASPSALQIEMHEIDEDAPEHVADLAEGTEPNNKPAALMRGICFDSCKGITMYTARVGFEWLHLRARRRRDMARAVDDHIALVEIRARATKSSVDADEAIEHLCFEERVRDAVTSVITEYGLGADFGLDIHVSIPAYYFVGKCLVSPYYNLKRLDDALHAWRRFRTARGQYGVGGAGFLYRCSPAEASVIWKNLAETYVDMVLIARREQRGSYQET